MGQSKKPNKRKTARKIRPFRHPLADYLSTHGLSQQEFSIAAAVEPSVLNKVLNGERWHFSIQYAINIHEATGGAVSVADCLLLSPEDRKRGGFER